MKKLINLMAVISLTASTSSLTVSCFGQKAKSITSYSFNVNNLVVGEPTQRALILALIEKNANINNLTDKEIEIFASLSFEDIKLQANSSNKYTATMSGTALSQVTTGSMKIEFTVDPTLLTYEVEEEIQPSLTGFWYGWGNGFEAAKLQNLNSNWNDKEPNSTDLSYEEVDHKYDVINLAYAVAPEEYNPAIDLWVNGNENICTLNPESIIWAKKGEEEYRDYSCKEYYEDENTTLLTAREQQDIKYTASIGGSSGDRMTYKWNQKNEVKQNIEDNLVDKYNLDGIDLNLAGKSIHDKTTKSVFSQALREIKLEHWIEGEDFLISLTSTFDGLKKSNYDINGLTYYDLIDSLNGYSDIIAPSTFNIFEGFEFQMLEEVTINEVVKTSEDTWETKQITYAPGERISRTIISQRAGFMYAYMKSLVDQRWAAANGIKYLGDQEALQLNINIIGKCGGPTTGLFDTNFHYSNFGEAFKLLTPEEQQKFTGFSGMFVNDNEFAGNDWLYTIFKETFIDKVWSNQETQ